MLHIIVPTTDLFLEDTNRFYYIKETHLTLEHSLISLSKWESKWKKPFLSKRSLITDEERLDYIRCMTITPNVDPFTYAALTSENIKVIDDYIDDPQSATIFSKDKEKGSNRIVTSELIYYWMFSLGIPLELERWHLNRLLTLIRVFQFENQPKKKHKMTRDDLAKRDALNRQRKAKYHTNG